VITGFYRSPGIADVSSRPPLRTGRAAFTASGSAPWFFSSCHPDHQASLTFSFTPLCQGASQTTHYSTHSWHNQLAHARDTTSCARTPKARGLRQGEGAPCGRRYRPPTTTPHPPLLSGIGISSGVSPFLLSTSLRILREASRVRCVRRKRNDGGGVWLAAPSVLCGSPVGIQGRAG